jgi:small-conductance mechanosensitive channel
MPPSPFLMITPDTFAVMPSAPKTMLYVAMQFVEVKTACGKILAAAAAFLNASLFAKNFKNLTTNHEYEFLPLNVGVAYGTDIDKARKVITDAINACNYKLDDGRLAIDTDKGVKVVVSKFGESSVDLFVSLWSDVAKKYWVKGRCLEAIYNALNANGIVIPFPQRDIHVIEKIN